MTQTGGESHNANSSEACRAAAALSAARAETTRIRNEALDTVLADLLKPHELSEQARELIAGLIGEWVWG